jgi:1-acyl-sn-glycerol-3-phosphate acyltransferase
MANHISNYILLHLMGWKIDRSFPIPDKCIICLAPHTSNWDFIIGQLYSHVEGFHANFLMKKEWFAGPLGRWLRKVGGIPVDRFTKNHMTDYLADVAKKEEVFRLAITPEGTRKPVNEWKKGFYFIALKANIPIIFFRLDYKKHMIYCNKTIIPDGNLEEQMKEIKDYYKGTLGLHPKNFLIEGVK